MIRAIIIAFTCMWLVVAAFIAWLGCALIGFIFAWSQYPWIKDITPLMGLSIVICIMKCIGMVWDSDPVAYLFAKTKWLESKLLKKKMQP